MKLSHFHGNLSMYTLLFFMMSNSFTAIGSTNYQIDYGSYNKFDNALWSQVRRFRFNRIRVKAPSNRITISASVRGIKDSNCRINKNKDIIALLPSSFSDSTTSTGSIGKSYDNNSKTKIENVELTTSAYPNILFYLPENSPETATFGLREFDKDGNIIPQRVYYINIKLPKTKNQDGIVILNVGDLVNKENIPELKVGKPYLWNVRFCENTKEGEISGLIRRVDANIPLIRQLDADALPKDVNPNVILGNELRKVNKTDYASVYAENGIWYSAVSSLAELLKNNPQNRTLQKNWQDLLTVSLKDTAKKPIIGSAKIDK